MPPWSLFRGTAKPTRVPLWLGHPRYDVYLPRYFFEGSWPDKYMRELTGLERAVHYWQALSNLASAIQARR